VNKKLQTLQSKCGREAIFLLIGKMILRNCIASKTGFDNARTLQTSTHLLRDMAE